MMHKAWSGMEEVPYCFSRSSVKLQGHTALKIVEFDPNWAFPDCNSSLNSPIARKWCTELEVAWKICPIVFSCDQAALQMVFSVCPSVTPFWLCFHHRIIMNISGVITNDQNKVHAKGQGQMSKVKVTEVTTQLNCLRTVTQVWIHIWWWNDAYIAWCCIEEVPYCFSRSSVKFQGHTALKIVEFDPDWAFPDCNSSLNSPMAMKWCTKLKVALKRCPVVFQGHLSNFKVMRL